MRFWGISAVLAAAMVTACGEPNAADSRAPSCADGERTIALRLDDRGRAPDWATGGTDRFFHEISSSVWCSDVSDDQLLQTAQTLIREFPQLCPDPAMPPEPAVRSYIDARTSGGPVRWAGMQVGREAVHGRFVAATARLYCQR